MKKSPTPTACNYRFRPLAAILSIICLSMIGLQPLAARTVREYVEAEDHECYDDMLEEFGENKILTPGYELEALLALSHYPELKSVRIHFMVDNVDIPLSFRPHWLSILRTARSRTYLVVIDNNRESGRNALLPDNQPFNSQIGILGHGLAHAVYYLSRSFFGILGDVICQLGDCRIQFERTTDRRLNSSSNLI